MSSSKTLALVAASVLTMASADTCGSSSDAGCGSTSAGSSSTTTDTPTPTTSTPTVTTAAPSTTTVTPTTTTATPTTTSSSSSSSSTETTVAPSTTTATPTTTSSAGSSTSSTPSSTSSSSSSTTTTNSGSSTFSPSTATDSSSNTSASSSSSSSTRLTDTSSSSSGASAVATSTGSSSSKTGLIIGATGGTVVFLVLVIFICARIRRKKQAKNRENTPRTYRSLTTPNSNNRSEVLPQPSSPLRASELWEDPAIMVFRIPLDKVIVQSLVSQGGYGEVYRGTYKGASVAIKMLHPGLRNDMKQINSFLAEAKILASIEHERLVCFIGVAWDSLRDLCVVTEFMEGGDLRSLLKRFEEEKSRSQGFDADKTKIAMHVAHALVYLHSLNPVVIHRDLKSRNILLDNEWNAKLTDFGVSRETSDQTMTAGVGTTLWMAPEVMMGERYNEKADIFSFGVVLTELDSHEMPYASAKNTNSGRTLPDTAILQKVALGRLQAQFSDKAPQWLRELGSACLSLDPNDRPRAGELLYALQRRSR